MKQTADHRLSQERAAQAAAFAAKLHSGNELTAEDETKLMDWLDADPANHSEYEKHLHAWMVADELPEDNGIAVQPKTPWRAISAIAAAVLLAVVSLVYTGFGDRETYVTATGEQQEIQLADGSQLILNTNTRLTVDYSGSYRRVNVDYGEAYFDVKAETARPFSVGVGDHEVTVLGTRFNVHKGSEKTTVAVLEGLVSVQADQQQDAIVRLPAGKVALMSDQGQEQPLVTEGAIQYDDWRHGIVTFDEQSLFEVLKEVNRYTRHKLLIEDRAIMDLKVSGVFSLSNLDAILEGLEKSFPVRVVRQGDRISLIGRDSAEG